MTFYFKRADVESKRISSLPRGKTHWAFKKPRSEETRKKISQSLKGRPLSKETRIKMSIVATGKKKSESARRNMSLGQSGAKGSNWKGGVTPIHKKIRHSLAFREWREKVFARDNWTCMFCKERGGELHPDHIKPFAFYPELRFEVSNGRTLCASCHRKTPTWGNRKRV